jgi:hypothetical protein
MQPLSIIGGGMPGVVVPFDQVTQLNEDRVPGVGRPRSARPSAGHFEPCCEDQQHLQVGEHDLAVGKFASTFFPSNAFDQAGNFRLHTVVQRDHGDAVRVVEQDAATANLGMERLDAEEVGVEVNGLTLDRPIWDESNVLIGDEAEEGVRPEGEPGGIGPDRPGAGCDEVDGEV